MRYLREMKLTYERTQMEVKEIKVTNSRIVSEYLKQIWPVDINHREAFLALYLNRANKTIGYHVVGMGGVAGTVADQKLLWQNAILCNASGVILCHNHPSGNLKPSQADLRLTKQFVASGKLLDITILDHLILTEESYYSMADEGEM